jgi:putative ABC transport system permease protein
MKPLNIKLLRDFWKMKGQVFAIALVIVSGVSAYVMLTSVMHSLILTKDKFYKDYEFAEVFASLKRAPKVLKNRISEIPGVEQLETRVSVDVKLDIKGFLEPVTARLVSVPDIGSPLLNKLHIKSGRMIDPWNDNEVIVSEAFAEAHRFKLGDSFGAVIGGRWRTLVIVGTALSPEFILQARPGAVVPDYKRYAILWMGRNAISAAYNMEGAFNNVSLTISDDAMLNDVLIQLDSLIDRYGGLGSYGRKDQLSHRFLSEELKALQRSAEIFPSIFIAVTAFLINVVISRIISLQREQIATLKAFGYSNLAIGNHYIKLVLLIVLIGIAGGIAVGAWFGKGLGEMYMEFYRFPYLIYELRPSVVITAFLVTIGAALASTIHSVWKAAMLSPAEAMQPEPPVRYRKTIIERIGLGPLLSQPTRIILRNIGKRPIKSLLTIIGISLSCAIMIASIFFSDAFDFIVNVQFRLSQKEDMTVTFVGPTPGKAVYELKGLAGIKHPEVFRSVPARLRFGHISYLTSIYGIEPDNSLRFILDMNLEPIHLPPDGVVITAYLGNILGIRPGDMLTVEILEGNRPVRQIPVAGFIKEYIGLRGYMDLSALNKLMREDNNISGAYLSVDSLYQQEIYRRLIDMPRVIGAVVREDEIRNFHEAMADFLLFYTFVASILAGTIAFGVVYNKARIAIAERSRELASLRVLGYTRAEISYIFLGELGLLTLAALPLGFIFGKGLCNYLAMVLSSDLFRIPVVVEPATYSLAATVVVVSACVSGLIVRRRLNRLNLIAALKTKE